MPVKKYTLALESAFAEKFDSFAKKNKWNQDEAFEELIKKARLE